MVLPRRLAGRSFHFEEALSGHYGAPCKLRVIQAITAPPVELVMHMAVGPPGHPGPPCLGTTIMPTSLPSVTLGAISHFVKKVACRYGNLEALSPFLWP